MSKRTQSQREGTEPAAAPASSAGGTRFRACGVLVYPKPEYLSEVQKRGLSTLSEVEKKKMLRNLRAGDWCDDVPASHRERLHMKGAIEEVDAEGNVVARVTRDSEEASE